MTMHELQQLEADNEKRRLLDLEEEQRERLRRQNGPGGRDAIPRQPNPFANKQVLQPLPGISYLSTSPVYYEMLAKRKKQKGQLSKGLTRRMITENRISSNIMNFNAPTAVNDFSDMELSVDYHTQVSQHKYMQSNFLPLMNLQILSKIPIDQILNPAAAPGHSELFHHFNSGDNHSMAMSGHSRKSRSNIHHRTNSLALQGSERHSRGTNVTGDYKS